MSPSSTSQRFTAIRTSSRSERVTQVVSAVSQDAYDLGSMDLFMVFHSRHLPTGSDVGPRVSHPATITRQTTPTSMRLLRSMNTAFAFGAPVSLSLPLCHPCATASSFNIAPNLCHSDSPHYLLTGSIQSTKNDHNITINFTPTTFPAVNGPSQLLRRPESRGPLVKHT